MEKSESIVNLITAVLNVMGEVKGIDKTMVIGSGNNTYRGVPDREVKKIIGESMQKNGLSILPVNIEESTQLSEWDETYNGQAKRKQQIFTKVKTTYLLAHKSGEFMTICGMGHGVDSQDKSAGKATTYALKYALLYTFLVPTGKIDDSDVVYSESIEVPQPAKKVANSAPIVPEKPKLELTGTRLAELSQKLEKAETVEAITEIYNANADLQNNETFRSLCSNRKIKVKKS